MMIEVFKTNVQEKDKSRVLIKKLLEQFPASKINFDLEDCDKILRIDSKTIAPRSVIKLLQDTGFDCEELADI